MLGEDKALQIVSRLEPYHFGAMTTGQQMYDGGQNSLVVSQREIVFNPIIDGAVVGNMGDKRTAFGHRVFVDTRSCETAPALKYRKEKSTGVAKWTLAEAVMYLCWALNPVNANVFNPAAVAVLEKIFASTIFKNKSPELQNVRIPLGVYLPEALDLLLEPYGFGWFVDLLARGSRMLNFFRLGDGQIKQVKYQAEGQTFDFAKTNVENFDVTLDVGRRNVNEVIVFGDWVTIESTWELMWGWPYSRDLYDLTLADLNRNAEDWADHPEHHDIYRKWVLNEGGDYIGNYVPVRTYDDAGAWAGTSYQALKKPFDVEPANDPTNDQFDYGAQIGTQPPPRPSLALVTAPHRRRFLPCLTLEDDGYSGRRLEGRVGRIQRRRQRERHLAADRRTRPTRADARARVRLLSQWRRAVGTYRRLRRQRFGAGDGLHRRSTAASSAGPRCR